MRFIQAKNYTKHTGPRRINLLVIHDMEFPETDTAAESVANYFAGNSAPQASAHYCIDNNSVVKCVHDHDIAWAAPGGNNDGLHFELAGRATQSRREWMDHYDDGLFDIATKLVAQKAVEYHVPVVKLSGAQVRAGHRGICGHKNITEAWPNLGSHTDPGDNFPWDEFMTRVERHHRDIAKR